MNGGGLDSACVAKMLNDRGLWTQSLFLRIGYPAEELQAQAAAETARRWCNDHYEAHLDLGGDPSHRWLDGTLGPAVGWTMLIVSMGIAAAKVHGCDEVYTGLMGSELPANWEQALRTLYHGVNIVRPLEVPIFNPLASLDKRGALEWAGLLADSLSYTVTCNEVPACGVCAKCKARDMA
jgi:7-cyano-7-deazaguanine synthase in queuosine biosynthesis